ncbi:MAG: efflux RND transporter periplasmic adaptor subunit [Candidatus Gastranaerophilales bacterium]|nr:efflux RND transporter periplasmic adaptor subunit [Candidatus Gastranaerophilales bacterium]
MKKKKQTEMIKAEETDSAKGRKKRKKAPIIIGGVLVLLLILRMVSCALTPDMGAVVTTTNAFRGELQESVSASGRVESGEQDVVFSRVNGRIDQVLVSVGDLVRAGDILISFDMEEMGNRLEQASLQQAMSDATYQGALADNAENQGKLTEANTNLAVLEQQIADYKAWLKNLQNTLSEEQRNTNNNLSAENFHLTQRQAELAGEQEKLAKELEGLGNELAELEKNGGADSSKTAEIQKQMTETQKRLAAIQEELTNISVSMAQNSYYQGLTANSDYAAEMQSKITEAQEQIADWEEYKARMESQKSSSEAAIMDSYDRTQREADNQLAHLTYRDAEDEYNAAKNGVVAAFDGVVTECAVLSGETVSESMRLLTVASSENVKITFQASKHDVEKLAVGQKADVTISGHSYQGEISKIDHMASLNESSTPMVGVEVQILDPDENIILGMDARLDIYTQKADNALLIPVEAINADREGDFLYVVEDGVVVRRSIVCGISSDTYTEVLEGITEEDQIILTSYTTLEEGMSVTVMPQ